jgi:hypothetical protein
VADPLIFGESESKETHDERSDEIPASARCAATHARGRAIIRVVRDTGPNPGPTEFVETLQQVVTADGNRWEKLQEKLRNCEPKLGGSWTLTCRERPPASTKERYRRGTLHYPTRPSSTSSGNWMCGWPQKITSHGAESSPRVAQL